MKYFLIFMLFMLSPEIGASLSTKEIKDKFLGFSKKSLGVESFSKNYQDNFSNITDTKTFFGTKLEGLKNKKANKIRPTYAYKGSDADLRLNDSQVLSQINGRCTAYGLAGVIENLSKTNLSENHIWSAYRVYDCETAIRKWEKGPCITTESGWPHSAAYPNIDYLKDDKCYVFLKKSTYIEDDLQKMIESLDKGHPVYLGISTTTSMLNCDSVLSPNSKSAGGGHALSIVGYKIDDSISGGGYFIIKNSWGTDCGDKGYQYVPFNYCQRNDLYCIMWTIDEIFIKTIPTPTPAPTAAPITPDKDCLEWKRIWYKPWVKKCIKWEEKINLLHVD